MNSKLSKSILEKINQEKIKPVSKYYFVLKNISFWILFLFMFMFGFISFSVILFAINNTDFDIFDSLSETSGVSHILTLLPLLWIFFIGIFLGMAIWGLQHTKRGYKIAFSFLFFGNILGSMILGSLVYGFGGAEKIENILDENINIYKSVRKKHQQFWANPKKNGRLSGIIQSVDLKNKNLILEDLNGRSWNIDFEKSKIRTDFLLKNNLPIKMKGEISEEGIFSAERISPAFRQKNIQEKRRKFFQKHPELRKRFKNIPPQRRQEIRRSIRETRRKL